VLPGYHDLDDCRSSGLTARTPNWERDAERSRLRRQRTIGFREGARPVTSRTV